MNAIEYPKINTIWKRESEKPCRIIVGKYSRSEFEAVNRWHITEKIDGTNVRVIWDGEKVEFRGRTDNAQMPTKLMTYLQKIFTSEILATTFSGSAILFGEGYGAGIQKGGGNYSKDQKFVLFEVLIDGWWLSYDNARDIASALHIAVVPEFGVGTTKEAIDLIERGNPVSLLADTNNTPIEGIVCRSIPDLFNRKGERVMWKLKVKDYQTLKG